MILLPAYRELLEESFSPVFAQKRTAERAIEHALAFPLVIGRRTVSRTICVLGREQQDWTADYRFFSKRSWKQDRLFNPILETAIKRYPKGSITIALDDTGIKKTGKKIATARWQYDHMSPPFHANLTWGLRFIAVSALFPHHREGDYSARAYPVRFQEAPFLKKPGKRATDEQRHLYKQQKKTMNLSVAARLLLTDIRRNLDQLEAGERPLLVAVDGSYCNETIFREPMDRTHVVARCRKDARLCWPVQGQGQRRYSADKFTPQKIYDDKKRPWRQISVFLATKRITVRVKDVKRVLWQKGARQRLLRVIVIAGRSYRPKGSKNWARRDPAFLLTTDLKTSLALLIQSYLDRWEIEVNHRDQKSILGLGQAQVWSPRAVARHPAFAAACYSLLLLASLKCFGLHRNEPFVALPKWRKKARRPSLVDLLTLLRREINETPISPPSIPIKAQNMLHYAYT